MEDKKPIEYLIKIVKWNYVEFLDPDDIFGTKQDWSMFCEPSKYNDKNLVNFVNFVINLGILKPYKLKNGTYQLYRPDKRGITKAQRMIETDKIFLQIESLYDITRNPEKGSQNL